MKKLLPLLFLVACTNIDVLESKLESCERRENEIYEKALRMKQEYDHEEALLSATRVSLEACYAELNEAKPKLVALPEPRPKLDLTDCRYVEGRSFCKEVGSKKQGVWVGFDCRRLTADHNFCDARKCMVITSDGKECSL